MMNRSHLWGVISSAAAEKMLEAQQHLLALGGKPLLTTQRLEPGSMLLIPGIIALIRRA